MNFNASVLEATGSPLVIDTVATGELSDFDVLVRIKATSLCHTDLEAIEGQLGNPLPLIPGHEAAGLVEWTGAAVRNTAIGDPVVHSWNPHCRQCFYCYRQQPLLCEQYRDNRPVACHFDGRPPLFRRGEAVHNLIDAGPF